MLLQKARSSYQSLLTARASVTLLLHAICSVLLLLDDTRCDKQLQVATACYRYYMRQTATSCYRVLHIAIASSVTLREKWLPSV